MGKKIPGKKHRGVKDPEKQRHIRLNSLKGKINAPPANPDVQEVPSSVNRIAEFKEQLKTRGKPKQSREQSSRNKNQMRGTTRRKKKFELYKQVKGESDKHFLHRVHKMTETAIQENFFENKYRVDIKRNKDTGEVEKLVKKPKDEIAQLLKEARKNQGKKKKVKKSIEPVLTKSQKRQKKLREKKALKRSTNFEIHSVPDVIKFGEVVHAPPSLNVPKKIVKEVEVSKPGKRNLLLKSVIVGGNTDNTNDIKKFNKVGTNSKKTENKVIDKTGKRKNLPNALRRRLEKQQAEIIDAYRALKKKRIV